MAAILGVLRGDEGDEAEGENAETEPSDAPADAVSQPPTAAG
jgi:hypothetical protein